MSSGIHSYDRKHDSESIMTWMVLLTGTLVLSLLWALRHHGRQGF